MPITQGIEEELRNATPPLATFIYNLHFTGAGVKSVTVPTGARFVLIGTTALPYYVSTTATAAVPTGDVVDGTGVSVSPTMRQVWEGDVFSIYSPTACEMSLEWYMGK